MRRRKIRHRKKERRQIGGKIRGRIDYDTNGGNKIRKRRVWGFSFNTKTTPSCGGWGSIQECGISNKRNQ